MIPAQIPPSHRQRLASVYVRQSTPLQVRHHQESTERQYHLRDRAIELGWPPTAVESSTRTRVAPVAPPPIAPAFSAWSPRSASARWASS